MTKSFHSPYGPSSAHRWFQCPASIKMTENLPSKESVFSLEGSLAHDLARKSLEKEKPPSTWADADLYGMEMVQHIDHFFDFIRKKRVFPNTMMVEDKVFFDPIIPQAFGTADVVILGEKELSVCDLKYGAGIKVLAQNNEQLMMYALGAFYKYRKMLCHPTKINFSISIFQPRLNHEEEFSFSYKVLRGFEKLLTQKYKETLAKNPNFQAGETQCRFCPAAGFCKARAEKNEAIAKQDFGEPTLTEAKSLGNDDLSKIIPHLSEIKSWLNALEEEAKKRLLKGEKLKGLKLIQSKSTRRWNHDALDQLKNADEFTEKKLLALSKVKKVLKKDETEPFLKAYTFEKEGALKVVPEKNRTDVYSVQQNAKIDFLENGETK